jgi:hypothetical protein
LSIFYCPYAFGQRLRKKISETGFHYVTQVGHIWLKFKPWKLYVLRNDDLKLQTLYAENFKTKEQRPQYTELRKESKVG